MLGFALVESQLKRNTPGEMFNPEAVHGLRIPL
jgi:hypothetical protein